MMILIAICGLLLAVISALHVELHFAATRYGTTLLTGKLILAAAACSLAAGLWPAPGGRSWLLVAHGLALAAFGSIYSGLFRHPLSVHTVDLLVIPMALCLWFLESRPSRRLPLIVVALTKLVTKSEFELLWLGAYFACAALGVLSHAKNKFFLQQNTGLTQPPAPIAP